MRSPLLLPAVLVAALAAGACGAPSERASDGDGDSGGGEYSGPLRMGVTAGDGGDIARNVADLAEESDSGLEVEVVEFSDYNVPNTALADGELDANAFQHVQFLDEFNEASGTDLVPVAETYLAPLALYSDTVDDPGDLPDGATIAIPNDVTNGSRSLLLLQEGGLITLDPGAEGDNHTVADIADNPRDFTFEEIDAALLPRSLEDADASIINGGFATEAGLTPKADGILVEDAENSPYVNIIAVDSGDEDDPRVAQYIELLRSPESKAFIEEHFGETLIPVF
ncbi:MetQ/NlpA family ABC transporter substrate-binding protein [Nocardiopsis sediminis]|uniref:Lipoprotein n=1 Tax=Nocardiopsis sediminis TaxID=1778267 RepID=A0ABV8FHG2_9ACTN